MEKSGSVLRQVCKGKNSQQFPWINEGGDSLASSWIDPKQPIFNMPFLVGGGGGGGFLSNFRTRQLCLLEICALLRLASKQDAEFRHSNKKLR